MQNLVAKANAKYSEEFVLHTLFCALKALQAMHLSGIVHGDIRAENVVCSADGTVKLVNLGIGVTLQEMAEYHKVRRVMPNWQAPEIIEGAPYTKEVDVWSLGCFAYELATGKQPFKMANWTKLLDHIVKREAPSIPSRWSADL